MNILKKQNINLPTFIFSIYLALSLYRFAFPGLIITLAMLITGLIPLLLFIKNSVRLSKFSYIFFILLLIFYIFSCILLNRYDAMPRNLIHLVNCFLVAFLILNGNIKSWGGYLVFYALIIYFFIFILRGIPVQEVLDYSSWNGISMMIIISCVSLYAINALENKEIDLIPATLALLFSFWGMGRSGILSCSILLIGLLILKFKSLMNLKSIMSYKTILFSVLVFTLLIFSTNPYIIDSAINTIAIVDRDTPDISTGRFEIWINYYNNLDVFRFIFGANIFTDPWPNGEELAYNLHNSFLRLFSYTGVMGVATIALMIAALLYFFRKNKLFFILFFVVVIRGFTDTIFFFESWDFLPLFFLFFYFKNSNVINANDSSKPVFYSNNSNF